jgi:hypothetical protein
MLDRRHALRDPFEVVLLTMTLNVPDADYPMQSSKDRGRDTGLAMLRRGGPDPIPTVSADARLRSYEAETSLAIQEARRPRSVETPALFTGKRASHDTRHADGWESSCGTALDPAGRVLLVDDPYGACRLASLHRSDPGSEQSDNGASLSVVAHAPLV